VFDKRRAKRGDDGQPVVTPDPGSLATRLNEAPPLGGSSATAEEGAAQPKPSRRALPAESWSITPARVLPRGQDGSGSAPCKASRLAVACAAAAGYRPRSVCSHRGTIAALEHTYFHGCAKISAA
jgi:hypothetical protein